MVAVFGRSSSPRWLPCDALVRTPHHHGFCYLFALLFVPHYNHHRSLNHRDPKTVCVSVLFWRDQSSVMVAQTRLTSLPLASRGVLHAASCIAASTLHHALSLVACVFLYYSRPLPPQPLRRNILISASRANRHTLQPWILGKMLFSNSRRI